MKKLIGLFVCASLVYSCTNNQQGPETTAAKTGSEAAAAEMKDYEFADSKFKAIGKKGLADLTSGDIDSWMNGYADNAVYRFNGGDSLAGKAAISAYWKNRRKEVIDSVSFTNDVWLPMKVNKPEVSTQLPGNYVLGWYMVYVKYKTGKSMSQRSHVVIHFDANDKIDRVTHYLDRVPINAATGK